MKQFTLASFSAERRIAAIAIFRGMHLEDTRVRHLSIDLAKSAGSVREMLTRVLEDRRPEFVAISCPSMKGGERLRRLCDLAKEIASQMGLPVVEVQDEVLLTAYGYPPLSRKEHVRRTAKVIWPFLNNATSRRAAVDAATAGLYVQTERLFSFYEAQE